MFSKGSMFSKRSMFSEEFGVPLAYCFEGCWVWFYCACARAYVHSALTVAPSSRAKVGMAGSSSSNSLPVDDIAKAVSEAVSSILSKLQNRNQEPETKLQQAV